jgi:hypothetical protein
MDRTEVVRGSRVSQSGDRKSLWYSANAINQEFVPEADYLPHTHTWKIGTGTSGGGERGVAA